MRFITTLSTDPRVRCLVLTVYYLAILIGVLLMWASGTLVTPSFIYQEY
jgi:hypothetical protein